MNLLSAIAGGLAGACTVTLLHEAIKKADSAAPRVDKLGMEALSTGLSKAGIEPPQGKKLYNMTLTGDIIANTMYYTLGALGKGTGTAGRTTFLGLLGGLGAVYLPEPMHLTKEFTNRTPRTKLLSVGLYTIGGIVAGAVMRALSISPAKEAKKAAKEVRKVATKVSESAKADAKAIRKGVTTITSELLN